MLEVKEPEYCPEEKVCVSDLLYLGTGENVNRAKAAILARWPGAKVEEDWDFIHEWRLSVMIQGCSLDEWAVWAIQEGLGNMSLNVGFEMYENPERVKGWIAQAKDSTEEEK